MTMLGSILLLLALAICAPPATRLLRGASGWVLGAVVLGVAAWLARLVPMSPEAVFVESHSWVPTLGLDLAFRLDGLSLTFALLITIIGGFVVIYSGGYLHGDPRTGRFYGFILFFLASMLGVVLSDNVIALFVFWELTSISSYLLIGFDHEKEEARKSALKALIVTGAGGVVLVAGLVLMRLAGLELGLDAAGSWNLSALATVDLRGHEWYTAIALLVFAGAFTKSAQVPFHFWLPAAMAAPTPTSALLHSATMVKAGVYLLARLHPTLGQTFLWESVVTTAGALTMVVGAFLAISQTDLKKILAYSTVSVLGILTMLVGVGTEPAIKAMVVFLVAHALYKATLFLIAGNIDHGTGTRDVQSLGGLRAVMPLSATAGELAALSKAGAPPLFGFAGKELLYKAKLDLETIGSWLIIAAVIANILLVATALLSGVKPFFGRRRETPHEPHEAPPSMLFGPLLLAGAGLFVGLVPSWFDVALGEAMATSIAGYAVAMKTKLWYGVSPSALFVLALSFVTVALGVWLFAKVRHRGDELNAVAKRAGRRGPTKGFERGLDAVMRVSAAVTRVLQSGYLRRYLRVIVVTASVAILVPAIAALRDHGFPVAGHVSWWEALVALIMIAGAIAGASTHQRLKAVAAIGVTGLGVAMIFVFFSAPDLAITQIMVETLTVILFVLVLFRMRSASASGSWGDRAADLTIALGAGLAVTTAFLAAAAVAGTSQLASWFATTSVPEAFGRNVVNVILVDFRALDTLGEITVVAVAGVGVYALLKGKRSAREEGEA